MTDYLLRASVLQGFRDTVQELNGDPDALLRCAGLLDALEDPQSWISYRKFLLLLEDARMATACPHFGLKLSRHQGIGMLGTVGFVMQQAPDLRSAIEALTKYFSHHNQGALLSLSEEDGLARWSFTCKLEGSAPTWQQLDLVAGVGLNLLRLLCRNDWRPKALYLAHAPPEDTRPYKQRFNCPVFFAWDTTLMTFDAALLDAPISASNHDLHRILEDYLSNLKKSFPDDYCSQVRHLIQQAMSAGDCSIERVADFLAVNKRTLQRQLSEHDTSYKALLEEVRFDLARRYLRESSGSLTTLADMLCYSELSAFSNAFRTRFGMSPRAWKKQELCTSQ
jgi:AraC-like DNA-binding protein